MGALRLPVFLLGMFMLLSALFAPLAAKAGLLNWAFRIAGCQALMSLAIFVAGVLDPQTSDVVSEAIEFQGEDSKGPDPRFMFGTNPVDWMLAGFAIVLAPVCAVIFDQPAVWLLGWSWIMLHASVRMVSRRRKY